MNKSPGPPPDNNEVDDNNINDVQTNDVDAVGCGQHQSVGYENT